MISLTSAKEAVKTMEKWRESPNWVMEPEDLGALSILEEFVSQIEQLCIKMAPIPLDQISIDEDGKLILRSTLQELLNGK